MSLGKAIQAIKPDVKPETASAEAKKAQKEADEDIRETPKKRGSI